MKFYIYPNDGSSFPSNVYDITDYIVDNEESQKRCDDAFAITTFNTFIPENLFPLAKFNIQPFTIFEIAPSDNDPGHSNNTRYFGTSKCIKYLRPIDSVYYYTHEITLYEPLILLEAIQIGTKTFTNHNDRYYLDVLSALIYRNTGYTVTFQGTFTNTEARSYGYDKGTTAFEIANDIFTINNYKMNAVISLNTNEAYNLELTISIIDLNNILIIAPLIEDNLTLVEYTQNQDNYCYSLESQVDNVVDRNTLSIWNNLTVKSDDSDVNADNCFVELPEVVESITELWTYITCEENLQFTISNDDARAIYAAFGNNIHIPFSYFATQCSWLDEWMQELKEQYKWFDINNYDYEFSVPIPSGGGTTTVYNMAHETDVVKWIEITEQLLPEDIYKALPDIDQIKYCYYRSGDNKVQGIYKYYRDNWLDTALGITITPMLDHIKDFRQIHETSTTHQTDTGVYATVDYLFTTTNDSINPVNNKWKASGHPITTQYVKDLKETPINATNNVKAARSYGNSANYIDYDLMRNNISISNKSLGTPELTLQYLNYNLLRTNTKFSYDNKLWYVKSIITSVTREHLIYTINAATDYNKQADSIGVRTQYQATKIALENIKQRVLYYRNETTQFFRILSKQYYLYLLFEFDDETQKEILLPCSLYRKDSKVTLVANAVDNYSAGKYYDDYAGSSTRFLMKDASYVDENGEAYKLASCKIVSYNNDLNIADARLLPNVSDRSFQDILTIATDDIIYKDEHESLSFTIYLPNVTIIN